jgi:hypothetical protein
MIAFCFSKKEEIIIFYKDVCNSKGISITNICKSMMHKKNHFQEEKYNILENHLKK